MHKVENIRSVQAAEPNDAEAMTLFVNMAGEGLPLYLWTQMAEEGQNPWELGRHRALRKSGGFSYKNTFLIKDQQNKALACLITYKISGTPEPIDQKSMPPMFMPLQELENLSPLTLYINVLATLETERKQGHASRLIEHAENIARTDKMRGLSIIVSDSNHIARRLYNNHGFSETSSRAMVKEDWINDGKNWVLLQKLF